MHRVLVGLTAAVLLWSSRGHGRADFIFVGQLGGPAGQDEPLPSSQGLTVDASEKVLVPDLFRRYIPSFPGSRPSFTSFDEQENRYGEEVASTSTGPTPSANSVVRDALKALARPLPRASTFFAALSTFGISSTPGETPSGRDPIVFADLFVADAIDLRSEMSLNDDPFLAKFGSLADQKIRPAAPSLVTVSPPGKSPVADKLANPKLVVSIALVALAVLGTLGYAWRRRTRRFHRTLRGPRRVTRYRSPSLPTPRRPTP